MKGAVENFVVECVQIKRGLIDAGVLWNDDTKHLELGEVKVIPGDVVQSIIMVEELE